MNNQALKSAVNFFSTFLIPSFGPVSYTLTSGPLPRALLSVPVSPQLTDSLSLSSFPLTHCRSPHPFTVLSVPIRATLVSLRAPGKKKPLQAAGTALPLGRPEVSQLVVVLPPCHGPHCPLPFSFPFPPFSLPHL